jgi:hypothetical protein
MQGHKYYCLSVIFLVFFYNWIIFENHFKQKIKRKPKVFKSIISCGRPSILQKTLNSVKDIFFDVAVSDCQSNLTKHILNSRAQNLIFPRYPAATRAENRLMLNMQQIKKQIHEDFEFWFHLEDDWVFDKNVEQFFEEAIGILTSDSNVFQVIGINKSVAIPKVNKTYTSNTVLRILSGGHGYAGSFTFNPFVMRTRDIPEFANFGSEMALSRFVGKTFGMTRLVALTRNAYYIHIGQNQSTVGH